MRAKLSSPEIQKVVGVERGRLGEWVARGYITPSIHEGVRQGDKHVWNEIDTYNVAVFKKIIESGFSRSIANKFISKGVITQDAPVDEIAFIIFAREGDRVESRAVNYDEEDPLELDLENLLRDMDMFEKDRQFDNFFILNFSKIRREVDNAIERLFGKREKWRERIEDRERDLKERYPDLTKK